MEVNNTKNMKEMDTVEILVEKERYAREGVHKGMQGWICCDRYVDGYWLVNFPQCYDRSDVAEISIHENDMKLIDGMDAAINERIFAKYGNEMMPQG